MTAALALAGRLLALALAWHAFRRLVEVSEPLLLAFGDQAEKWGWWE